MPATRELPGRASLENLRKQAKALHRGCQNADADAVERVRTNLPRINELDATEVAGVEVSRQEAQHVLAKEYGFSTWEDLSTAVEAVRAGTTFEVIADLHPAALQGVFRQTDRADWLRALPTTTERTREAVFFACMTRSAVREFSDEMAATQTTADEAQAAQVRLLEAASRLAVAEGFEWPPQNGVGDFEDLSRLTDVEIQNLLREVSQKDLCRALVGASDEVWGRTLGNMSQRVRTFVFEEAESVADSLPSHEPAASRQRVLELAQTLARDERIQWPPPTDREAWSGDLQALRAQALSPPQRSEDPLGGLTFEELSIDELASVYSELAAIAQKEGILALDEVASGPGPLREGIRLAVDGTVPELIETILNTRTETMVHNRRTRLRMFLEGVASLQAGDNPWIVYHKMQVFYLDSGAGETLRRANEDLTASGLRDWIERGWLGHSKPSDIAELMLHLAFVARRDGLESLAPAAEALDHPLLKEALQLAADRRSPAELKRQLQPKLEEERAALEGRLRGVTAGVLGIMAKKKPGEVADDVRAAADAS